MAFIQKLSSFAFKAAPALFIGAGLVTAVKPAFAAPCADYMVEDGWTTTSSNDCSVIPILETCIPGSCFFTKVTKGSHCASGSTGTGLSCHDTRVFVPSYYMSYPCQQAWLGPIPNGCAPCSTSSGTWLTGSISPSVPTCACVNCGA